ncbi:MAG: class I SAM-dependent methyltransferase [Coriobacteriia bacterium]|nr:class I SAM-dependent methyltransferase [Coriobacteriia bacterium]
MSKIKTFKIYLEQTQVNGKKRYFYTVKIGIRAALAHFRDCLDSFKDKKICGCSLVKYVPSLYRETKGSTGTQASKYFALDKIFENQKFSANDKFVDIGCGKARVLAHLIDKNFPGKLYGIEINHDVAEFAKAWTVKYHNITIIEGDVFEHDLDTYNIFFLGRPFETEYFIKFIDKFEKEITRPVKFFYWWDNQSGNYLDNRPGWKLNKRSFIYRNKILYVSPFPQRYSIWTYTPSRKNGGA